MSDAIDNLRQEIKWLQDTILERDKQLAEARALLMHFAKFDPTWVIDGNPCLFCNARVEDKNVIHKPDCFWVDTHLFLTNQSR